MIHQLGELIPSWNGDGVFWGVSLNNRANQIKLFNPITAGVFGGITGDLFGATAFVAVDIVAIEMTQSQISCSHHSH